MIDDFWREAVALKRYRSHPMMLIGDEPQSYPSYRDIVCWSGGIGYAKLSELRHNRTVGIAGGSVSGFSPWGGQWT